ncbi:MAG: glutamate racemase [Clostridia bacterium]|nr:glutamate racemase [Clostridia bacterium]
MVIGVIDSGIGGLTTLKEIIRVRGGGDYIYYLDNARHPYGTRTPSEIHAYMRKACDTLTALGAEAIAIACNTATAVCIDALRKEYSDTPFIGIEPSIKPAVRQGGNVCVLATPLTLKQDRFSKLLTGATFHMPDCTGLADAIEEEYPSLLRAQKTLTKALYSMSDVRFDSAVLGCTHYSYLKEWISKRLNCPCFDGNGGVARQTRRICGEETCAARIALIVTAKGSAPRYLEICRKFTGAYCYLINPQI